MLELGRLASLPLLYPPNRRPHPNTIPNVHEHKFSGAPVVYANPWAGINHNSRSNLAALILGLCFAGIPAPYILWFILAFKR